MGFRTALDVVRDRLLAIGNTAIHPDADMFHYGIGYLGVPSMGIAFDVLPPVEPEKYLSPGLRQLVLYMPLRPKAPVADGETVLLTFRGGAHEVRDPVLGVRSVKPSFVPGRLRFGSAGIGMVRNLDAKRPEGAGGAAAGGAGVSLAWENGDVYDTLRVERDGEPIAEIPGSASSFRDEGLAPGVYVYKVIGKKAGEESFPASAFVSTLSSRGTFLRGDTNRDGDINITDPLVTLEFLFRGGPPPACDDATDSNDDGEIGLTDAIITLQHLFLGGRLLPAPGTAYAWFDPTPDKLGCGG